MSLSQESPDWFSQRDSSVAKNNDQQRKSEQRTDRAQGRPLLTGPILPTPDYDNNDRPTSAQSCSRGAARVHGSDAVAIHKRGTNGTAVPFMFEVQGTSVFPNNFTSAKPPKNHLNENVRRIRRVMRDTQQRQRSADENKATPVKALWQSKQYDHVQSKVKQRLDEETNRSLSRPQSARTNFLHARENTGPRLARSQSASSSARRASISSSADFNSNRMNNDEKLDFIKINSQWAKSMPKVRKKKSEQIVEDVRAKQDQQLKDYHERQKGRVPDYIERIKEAKAQRINEERANARDPDCPVGHVKLDEDKRMSTLQKLELSRAELEKKLSHLPIRNDSLTLRRTKEEIEKKMIETDEAIKIFSKPKVFVRVEE